MDCSLQAHLRYDVREVERKFSAAAVFGTVIHAVMNWYNNHPDPGADLTLTQARNLFLKWWGDPGLIGEQIDYYPQRTSWNTYRDTGLAVIENVHDKNQFDKRALIATEADFLVPFGEHKLTGRIDLVEVRWNGKGNPLLRIIDYKGSSRQPTKAELALNVQMTTYDYAVGCPEFWIGDGTDENPGILNGQALMDQYFDLPHRAIWYHLRGPKEIDAGPRDEKDFGRLYRVATEIEKADRLQVHVPKIGKACEECDFLEQCPMDIPVELEVRPDDPNAWV